MLNDLIFDRLKLTMWPESMAKYTGISRN